MARTGIACALAMAMQAATAYGQQFILQVDPYSGLVKIHNSSTVNAALLDGYQITSQAGSLSPGAGHWNSLTAQGLPGWQTIAPTTHALSELNLSSATSLAPGADLSIGNAFTSFGTADVSWGWSIQNGSSEVTQGVAPVQYVGGFELRVYSVVDSNGTVGSTHVVLNNPEPVALNLDGYQITSAGGSLAPDGFSGFASAGVPGWQSVAPSANGLSELNLSSSTSIAAQHDRILGSSFTAGATQDLSFNFHLVGQGGSSPAGAVSYITQLAGDVNNDGIVNGQDLALVSSNWLGTNILPGDATFDGIVNAQDLAIISSNWLHTYTPPPAMAMATAVPEPGTLAMMSLGAVVGVCRLRGLRRSTKPKSCN